MSRESLAIWFLASAATVLWTPLLPYYLGGLLVYLGWRAWRRWRWGW